MNSVFTPKPTDGVAIGEARMLVHIGLGMDDWVEGSVKSAHNPQLLVVITSDHLILDGWSRIFLRDRPA